MRARVAGRPGAVVKADAGERDRVAVRAEVVAIAGVSRPARYLPGDGTTTTCTCRPGWLVPAPSTLSTSGTKLARPCSVHGNSGAYRARICSVGRLSADSLIMFGAFASRNARRSSDAVVTFASRAAKSARCAAIVLPVTPKSFSACRIAGRRLGVGPGQPGKQPDVGVQLRQLRVELPQVGIKGDQRLAEFAAAAAQSLRDRGQGERELVWLDSGTASAAGCSAPAPAPARRPTGSR